MAVLVLFRPFKELHLSQVIPDIVIPSVFRSSNWSSYSLLDRMGRPRFISLPSFCRDSLANMFFRDEVAATGSVTVISQWTRTVEKCTSGLP